MSGKCRGLGYIITVLGILGSIYLAYQFGNVYDFEFASQIYYERNWGLTCLYFCIGCFSTILLGTIFFGLAEIMDKADEVKKQQQYIIDMLNSSSTK